MSRISLKTVSSNLVEFIPKAHLEDAELSRTAKEISKRPLIFKVRKLTREDKFNIRSLAQVETREVEGEDGTVVTNSGTVLKYIWENCVIEVLNVLTDEKEHESVKGDLKNQLFGSYEGMDTEIMEAIHFVQNLSTLTDTEAKN